MRTEKVARVPIQESAGREIPQEAEVEAEESRDTDGQHGIQKEANTDTDGDETREGVGGKKEETNWH